MDIQIVYYSVSNLNVLFLKPYPEKRYGFLNYNLLSIGIFVSGSWSRTIGVAHGAGHTNRLMLESELGCIFKLHKVIPDLN